ncbi:MAG: ABC transporter substrate-binding protein [Acidihalobacter sp.]|uniref:ABC transporter substrate-binding protein n=1 Tax=Acidihalobacter sp. TaxID=1872108 RepID=UPI00307CCE57
MNKIRIGTIAAGLVLSLGILLGFAGPADAGVTVSIACGSVGAPNHITCVKAAKQWAAKTGNRVRFVTTPYSSTARLSLYEQWIAAHADIDVLMTDVYYPGILKNDLVDLMPYFKNDRDKFFPAYMKVDTIDGKLLAVPWFAAVGVMYYRKDLLEKYGLQPPKTWAELQKDAKLVQAKERAAGHPNFWGFVWQGKAYEGLTCDAVEWLASYGGGSIVGADGKVTIDNPRAIAALTMAKNWVGTISPRGVLSSKEPETLQVFYSGNALFMRNWPYVWSIVQKPNSPLKGKVGVMPIPKGPGAEGRNAGTIGGWALALSKYGKHRKQAISLIKYLTSYEVERMRFLDGALMPTRMALYKDQAVLDKAPVMKVFYKAISHASPRPSAQTGAKYNRVSSVFYTDLHQMLLGESSPQTTVKAIAAKLNDISSNGKNW